MGVDFIDKIGRGFEKHLDLARAQLGTDDLFKRSPIVKCRTIPIDVSSGVKLRGGQQLSVEVSGKALIFRDVLTVVARYEAAPTDIIQAVEKSSGVAVAIVQEVHDLAAVAEVTLC